MDAEVTFCDLEFGYPLMDPTPAARFHQVGLASLPEAVELDEFWVDTRKSRRERLDRTNILDWLGTILGELECPSSDTKPGWGELRVDSVRARLPDDLTIEVTNGTLPVEYGGVIDFPVERIADALWVAGPIGRNNSATSPFDVRIVNEGGSLTLHLRMNWSTWIEGPGHPGVIAAGRRLSTTGWEVSPFMVGGL